jgi:hypothetical protein
MRRATRTEQRMGLGNDFLCQGANADLLATTKDRIFDFSTIRRIIPPRAGRSKGKTISLMSGKGPCFSKV